MKTLLRKFGSLSLGIRVIALTLVIITAIVVVNNLIFINKYRS